jgi:hypothetical protein
VYVLSYSDHPTGFVLGYKALRKFDVCDRGNYFVVYTIILYSLYVPVIRPSSGRHIYMYI